MIVAIRPASRPSNTVTQTDLIRLQTFLSTIQELAFTPRTLHSTNSSLHELFTPRTRRGGFLQDFVLPFKSTVDLAPLFPSSVLGVTLS